MNHFRVMVRGLGDLVQSLELLLPPWAVGLLVAVVAVALLPAWIDNMRVKQIRGTVRRMVRASEPQRLELAERAIRLAGRRRVRLDALVHVAHRYQQVELRRRGLQALEALDPASAKQHREAIEREKPKEVLHPLEVVVRVERLLSEGLTDAAQARLDEALERHPDDPDLLALRARVRSA